MAQATPRARALNGNATQASRPNGGRIPRPPNFSLRSTAVSRCAPHAMHAAALNTRLMSQGNRDSMRRVRARLALHWVTGCRMSTGDIPTETRGPKRSRLGLCAGPAKAMTHQAQSKW
eukprot:CAMPEP_0174312958 /NCGR_PEP_ID=MMETSP0810-20121108/4652_1 /TAXON_ID=73025 ORGANISM="Eutreptiella gymnastica-like, Strain CCMP1594" /NCGR_SAMPLE_ID=MMETSP0810 /ASSEMBLY_ACC=CAM_ASM_000659 /LENGTH=117 /DNA_ID=CAMNT_0015421555 /DNA_START=466 /DNA_END=816 /DNA_ORIENTATION=+